MERAKNCLLIFRRRPEVLRRGSESRSAVVPLHDQLATRVLHLDARGERRHIVGYTGKHKDKWPKGHATALAYMQERHGLRSAVKCRRKAASRTSACR